MKDIIKFEQNGIKYLVVEFPRDACDFTNKIAPHQIDYTEYNFFMNGTVKTSSCVLLKEYWNQPLEIISTIRTTEEQAAEMVESVKFPSSGMVFYNLYDTESALTIKAKDSLKSRIRSLGGSDDANYVILKEVK